MLVVALGTYVDNLLRSKVAGLLAASPEVRARWLTDHPGCRRRQSGFSYPEIERLEYEYPPLWLQRVFGRNAGKAIWAVWISFKRPADVYVSFAMRPHGITLFIMHMLHGFRLPCIHHIIGSAVAGELRWKWATRLAHGLYLRMLRTFPLVLAKGSRSEAYLRRHGIRRTGISYGAIDTERFAPGAVPAEYDFITVGRIEPLKNQTALLPVLAELKASGHTSRLAIVGRDMMGGALRERIRELGIGDMIDVLPFHPAIETLYQKSRIYVQPSLTEGLSTALREAMACGLPAIATDVGDTRDVVQDGETGFLIHDPMDQAAYVRAMTALLTDPHERDRMGARARQALASEHSLSAEGRRYRQAFAAVSRTR